MTPTSLGTYSPAAGPTACGLLRTTALVLIASLSCVGCGSHEQYSETPLRREVSLLTGVALGTPADSVLEWRGRSVATVQVGSDAEGLLVEWRYPDGTYLMGRRELDGITAYRVVAIFVEGGVAHDERSGAPRSCDGAAESSDSTRTLKTLLTSCFASKFRLQEGEGWSLRNGDYYREFLVPDLEGEMFGVTTRGSDIVGAGVLFIGTSTLDVRQTAFVLDMLAWLSPSTEQDSLLVKHLHSALRMSVPQIMEASPFQSGTLLIHAGNVGGDATISVVPKTSD